MIIRAAVTCSDIKNIAKNCLQSLATPNSTTTDAMAWKIFSRYSATIKKLTARTICESDQN